MPRIKTIAAEGFRGRSFRHELATLNYVHGPHGSGKTSVSDALRFAALGYVPDGGKDSAALSRLMSGRALDVALVLDDGTTIDQGLIHSRGSVSGVAAASWSMEKGLRAHQAEIVSRFGVDRREVEENLDLRTLLNASPQQRAGRLEEILDATGATTQQMREWLSSLMLARMAGADADAVFGAPDLGLYEAALFDQLAPHEKEGFRKAYDHLSPLLAEGIANLLETANRMANEHGRVLAEKRAARGELEDRQAELPKVDTTIDALQEQRDGHVARMGELGQKRKAAESHSRSVAHVGTMLADAKDADAALGPVRIARGQLEEERERLQTVLGNLPVLDVATAVFEESEGAKALQQMVIDLGAKIGDEPPPLASLLPEPVDVRACEVKLEHARGQLEQARGQGWSRVAQLADVVYEQSVGDLPDAVNAAVDELRELAHRWGPDLPALEQAVTDATHALEAARREATEVAQLADAARKRHHTMTMAHKEAVARHKSAQDAYSKHVAQEREGFDAEVQAQAQAVNRRNRERERMQREIETVDGKLAEVLEHIAEVTRKLAEAQAAWDQVNALEVEDDRGAWLAELGQLEGEVKTLDAQIEELRRVDAAVSELGRITEDIANGEWLLECYRAADWAGQRIRERDLSERGRGIVQRMGAFLRAAGRTEVPYFKAEQRQVDFGWLRDGKAVHVSQLSGAEMVLFGAALGAAIVAMRAPQVRVLLIEAAESGLIMAELVKGLEAVAGDLDTVIVSSYHPPSHLGELGERWKVITTESVPV